MKPKVLIIDDEPGIIEIIEAEIMGSGVDVERLTATSVDQALKIIDEHKPAVIFSDIMMPGKTGLDLLKDLKARGIKTPVVIISGYGNKEIISEAWKLGAFDFLDKPINSKRLIENLKIALEMGEDFNATRDVPRPPSVRFTLDKADYDRLLQHCKKANLKVEDWVRSLVLEGLK